MHRPATPRPPARRRHGGQAPRGPPGALPGTPTAAGGREGAKYRTHTEPSHNHVSPPKPYPPKAAFPEGRPRPVRPSTPKRTPMGITLRQLQRRVVQAGGDGYRAGGGASQGGAGRGAEGDRGRLVSGKGGQAPGEGEGAGSSARRRTQGKGQGARGNGGGQGHGQGASASSSGGGQAQGTGKGTRSGRRDTGHGKGHG